MDYNEAEGTLFFNSSRTYTLALLDLFSSIKHYIEKDDGSLGEEVIPIQFGNYEKSVILEDIRSKDTNRNVLPRMVLSFEGMTRASYRSLNKNHKFSMKVMHEGRQVLRYTPNSTPYDFQFKLLIQARGMNQAFQIVEQILPKFRPSVEINIQELPLFDETTKTQVLISDPTFDINDEMEDEDINIINISIDITIRGNLYLPINIVGPIEVVKMFFYSIKDKDRKDAKLASKFKWTIEEGQVINEESSHFPSYEASKNIEIIKE